MKNEKKYQWFSGKRGDRDKYPRGLLRQWKYPAGYSNSDCVIINEPKSTEHTKLRVNPNRNVMCQCRVNCSKLTTSLGYWLRGRLVDPTREDIWKSFNILTQFPVNQNFPET